MATPIPTRIKQNIRDQITAPDAPLNNTTSTLSTLLGYPISFDPEYGMLWAALQPHYPDQSTFIPSIVNVLTQWCRAFTAWIEDEGNEVPVERLLDALKGCRGLRLVLEIAPTSPRPTTSWRTSKSVFVVALPQTRLPSPQTTLAGFASDLLHTFTLSPSQRPALSPSLTSSTVLTPAGSVSSSREDLDAWADLSLDLPAARPRGPGGLARLAAPPAGAGAGVDFLPDLATLERPEEMCVRAPYRLVVRQLGSARVEVQASHQGSLLVLEGYLKHWVRHNADFTNRPPLAEISLRDSIFGLGLLYDTLVIEASRNKEVNALLVLTLVENVLGYESVGEGVTSGATIGGGVWEYRRERGFK